MVQRVKALPTKPDDPFESPGPTWWEERQKQKVGGQVDGLLWSDVSVSPTSRFTCWNPTPQDDDIMRWVFGEAISHGEKTS